MQSNAKGGGLVSQAAQASTGGGRYVLIRKIASGGLGKIWEARDSQLNRTVAIKQVLLELIPQAEHAEYLARAAQEGRNAAALADHPNIVTVYDVVVEAGAPWTVMQRVNGRSLAQALEPGPLPVEAAAALADFGIAKNSTDATLTQTGVVIGSTPYMAPERHEGESGTAASDLFSLGITLFEAVEGYSPFAKDSRTRTVTAILVKPLPEMRRAGRLTPLILALTEKDPLQRPTVAHALAMLRGPTPSQVPPALPAPPAAPAMPAALAAPAAVPRAAPVPRAWLHSGTLGVPSHAVPRSPAP